MLEYNKIRRNTTKVKIGSVYVGGDSRIAIQSMTNTDTHNAEATIAQIKALEAVGCDIVRITVPDLEAAETVKIIKSHNISIPIVADIHFDYRIAIKCAEYGIDKIRINPGNIGDEDRIRAVCDACGARGIPIRIGVNSGSLEKHLIEKHGRATPEALLSSAVYNYRLLEKFGFYDTVISIKASSVSDMITANRMLAENCQYPIHLGVTEAGNGAQGLIKSSAGIGSLLCDGIGDTIRVSLTDNPVEEINAAKSILTALEIKGQSCMNIVSCPTCGRTGIDLISLANRFKKAIAAERLDTKPIKVALMGCIVNGPGESRDADIGIAGGKGEAVLFKKGEIIRKIPEDKIIETLISEIKCMNT